MPEYNASLTWVRRRPCDPSRRAVRQVIGGSAMGAPTYPTTLEIASIFADEIRTAGGDVRESFDDGDRLFARAVLPEHEEISPGDTMQAGVAIRSVTGEILVHPYLFRLVCKN